jgi:glutathione S-transferase
MHKLTHFRLCPFSRSIRLAVQELGLACELVEEPFWEWRQPFLALNPAGEVPVLELEDGPVLCGAYAISEYLGEMATGDEGGRRGMLLFPGRAAERAEVRRLVDWFQRKLDREVTRELLVEKVYARLQHSPAASPNSDTLRAVRANLRYHMGYIGYLAHERRWLAGEEISFADFAAAAQLSTIDYVGEVPWEEFPVAKSWYARIKSRPGFRGLLADRIPGAPPPPHYDDLDF